MQSLETWDAFERRCMMTCLTLSACAGVDLNETAKVCLVHAWPSSSPFSRVSRNVFVKTPTATAQDGRDKDAPEASQFDQLPVFLPSSPTQPTAGARTAGALVSEGLKTPPGLSSEVNTEALLADQAEGPPMPNGTHGVRPPPALPPAIVSNVSVNDRAQLVVLGGAIGLICTLGVVGLHRAVTSHKRLHRIKKVAAPKQRHAHAHSATHDASSASRHVESVPHCVSFTTHHTAAVV